MFRFGKQVESALIALKDLNESPNGLSTADICDQHGLSRNTLAKIMQSLLASGILRSEQGLKGGYALNKSFEKISFYDVLDSLGEIKNLPCFENSSQCVIHPSCTISSPLLKWEKKMMTELKKTSLKSLLYLESEASA